MATKMMFSFNDLPECEKARYQAMPNYDYHKYLKVRRNHRTIYVPISMDAHGFNGSMNLEYLFNGPW